jgi:hypothetical protein
MNNINIQDDSGDKKYFTIIPNYILNHSTLWDREVYIQMKRITGEEGTCWTSQKTLAKQCGMSINRLKKSLSYLVEHKWIQNIGKKEVITRGGIQEVNEYKIADLWKLNSDFYESKQGVSQNDIPKGVSPKQQRGVTDEAKGVSPGDDKEEPYINKIPIKEEQALSLKNAYSEFNNVKLTDTEKNKLLELFGESGLKESIEELGTYIASTGKKYSSHYATILSWNRRKTNNKNYKSKNIIAI